MSDKSIEQNIEQSIQLFELQPGKSLDLQMNNPVPLRLKLQLVGYDIGKYIILKYPKGASTSEYKDVLADGNVLIVRYLMEGNKGECFAFRSSIKSTTQYPEKLLFIEYPKKIENRQLRLQQRTSIHLPAIIMLEDKDNNESTEIIGIIGDISAKGCGSPLRLKVQKLKSINVIFLFVCKAQQMGK